MDWRGEETIPAVSPGKSTRSAASQVGGGSKASQKYCEAIVRCE